MKKRKSAVFDVIGYIVSFLIVLIVVLPLFWLIVSSFKSDADVIKWPPHFFPSEWVSTQYRYVMKAIPVLSMLKNTVIFAGCVTVISLFFDSLAALRHRILLLRIYRAVFSPDRCQTGKLNPFQCSAEIFIGGNSRKEPLHTGQIL